MRIVIFAISLAILITGCSQKSTFSGKVDNTPYATKECIKELSRGAEIDATNLVDTIVVYKSKRVLYAYKDGKKIYEFRISMGKNWDKGAKVQAGDYKTPEGSYKIIRKKCDNRLYKSLLVSYPNAKDRAKAKSLGVRTGGYITIHGQPKWNADGSGDDYTLEHDWTEGCVAIPNKDLDKLWKSVRNGVSIDIKP